MISYYVPYWYKTMAIIKNTKLIQDESIEIENAYFRIESISGTKNKMSMTVSIYSNKNNSIPGKQLFSIGYIFIPNLDEGSDNIFKQGYTFLKSLPEFIDAKDDLDIIEELVTIKEPSTSLPIP